MQSPVAYMHARVSACIYMQPTACPSFRNGGLQMSGSRAWLLACRLRECPARTARACTAFCACRSSGRCTRRPRPPRLCLLAITTHTPVASAHCPA